MSRSQRFNDTVLLIAGTPVHTPDGAIFLDACKSSQGKKKRYDGTVSYARIGVVTVVETKRASASESLSFVYGWFVLFSFHCVPLVRLLQRERACLAHLKWAVFLCVQCAL